MSVYVLSLIAFTEKIVTELDDITSIVFVGVFFSGNALKYEIYSGKSMPEAAAVRVSNGRKKIRDEISKYLDGACC